MPVQQQFSQHEAAERLPLVTDSATVTAVEAMDESREDEVARAAARHLRHHGEDHLVEWGDGGDCATGDGEADGDTDPPDIDWDRAREVAQAEGYESVLTLSDRHERAYPSLLRIHLDPDTEIEYAAGQYVAITFHRTPRPYSIASAPGAEGIELCVRRVPGGKLTTDLFEALEVGDEVAVRGPNGDFVPEDQSSRDRCFLATGTGVAPLRGMIQYMFGAGTDVYEGESRDVWLFLGTGWRDHVPYREEFRSLAAEHDNFHFVPCLSREQLLTDWDGETDYVQHTLCAYLADDVDGSLPGRLQEHRERDPRTDVDARVDPSSLEVYACGTNAMVEPLVDVADEIGVPGEHVWAEGYG